jgi:hypothetical protein
MLKKNSIILSIALCFVALNYIFYLILIDKFPHYVDEIGNINLDKIHFFFGDVIKNLVNKNEFSFVHGYHGIEVDYVMGRLPLIPIFLTLIINFITKKYFIILLCKNLFLFFILFYIINKIFNKSYFLIISFFLFCYNPHNIFTFLSLIPEEGFTSYFILALFLLITKIETKKDILISSILLFAIFLTKAAMIYLCYSISIYLFFKLRKKFNFIYSILPILFILIAYSAWASFGYLKTQKLISPISISTMSGSTLIVSSNKEFKNLYHLATPDPLESKMWLKHKDNLGNGVIIKDEFEINDYFVEQSKNYIVQNKLEYLKVTSKKLHVVFTNIKKDAQPISGVDFNSIRYSNIPNKLILLACIFFIIKNFYNKKIKEHDAIYLLVLVSFLFPYLIGWVYTRHVVPIYIVSHFYLLLQFREHIDFIFKKKFLFN